MTESLYTTKIPRFDLRDFCSIVRMDVLKSGLRQIYVAKKIKHPQSCISRVESGEYRLDILKVKALARLYKKSVDDLIR